MAANHKSELDPNEQEQKGCNVAKQLTVDGIPEYVRLKVKRRFLTLPEERALGEPV